MTPTVPNLQPLSPQIMARDLEEDLKYIYTEATCSPKECEWWEVAILRALWAERELAKIRRETSNQV